MTIRVGINGFGRIGRNVFRAARAAGADIDFVAVNDLGDLATMAHLLKYDSAQGNLDAEVVVGENTITVDGDEIKVTSERNPQDLRWGDLGVDVVVESTGIFKSRDQAAMHLEAGASRVLISAPSPDADLSVVFGYNHTDFDPDKHKVLSNASCTTNCFVPMVKVLEDAFGLDKGLMTTIHAYTGTQNLVDGPHKDLRRARGAATNLIPTSTGSAKATQAVMDMQGQLDAIAVRVPLAAGSLTDFVANVERDVTAEEVNAAFAAAASDGPLAHVLDYTEEPLVSSDIVGSSASCIFDSGLTRCIGNMVKIAGWYDNETGYSNRLVDLILHTAG